MCKVAPPGTIRREDGTFALRCGGCVEPKEGSAGLCPYDIEKKIDKPENCNCNCCFDCREVCRNLTSHSNLYRKNNVED